MDSVRNIIIESFFTTNSSGTKLYSYAYLTHLLSNNGNDPGKNPVHVICETEVHTYFSSFQLKLNAPESCID